MSTGMIIPIAFFAVAIILILVALGWVVVNKRQRRRQIEAEKIRDQAKEETLQVSQREALAEETAAKARVVQADAEVKAAQASGLQQQAAAHRSEAGTSRDRLNEQWDRAETLDPATRTPEATPTPEATNNTRTGGIRRPQVTRRVSKPDERGPGPVWPVRMSTTVWMNRMNG